jgi:hypothetical protein
MQWWEPVLQIINSAAAISVPIAVLLIGHSFNRRLKLWEANQWRNQELIKIRVAYYQAAAPKLNDLMCYFTFIGQWKALTPPEVLAIKRRLDREFYSALPLFSAECAAAYDSFITACFEMFGSWGQDARLRTGYVRRRDVLADDWQPEWERMFTYREDEVIGDEELHQIRKKYDAVLGALARDIELFEARDRYATELVTPEAR